jgi:hypothetical protein
VTVLSDIRPTARPIAPLVPAAPRSAAQRAFFDAALGRATGDSSPVQAAPVQTAPARPEAQPSLRTAAAQTPSQTASLQAALRNLATFTPAPAPDPAAETPRRILRPGSLVDIKV